MNRLMKYVGNLVVNGTRTPMHIQSSSKWNPFCMHGGKRNVAEPVCSKGRLEMLSDFAASILSGLALCHAVAVTSRVNRHMLLQPHEPSKKSWADFDMAAMQFIDRIIL